MSRIHPSRQYEKVIMALHDPRYGDQLKATIKIHNLDVAGKTIEILDRYRYSMVPLSPVMTGTCEVCNKPVRIYADERFWRQKEERALAVDGDPTHWTTQGCHDLSGHQKCLYGLRKPQQGVA